MDNIRSFTPGKGWTESLANTSVNTEIHEGDTPNAAQVEEHVPTNAMTNDPAVLRSHFRADGRRLALQPISEAKTKNSASHKAVQPEDAGKASGEQDSAAQTILNIGKSIEHILQALSQDRDVAARLGDVVENLQVISQRLEEQQLLEQRLDEVKADIRMAKAEIPVLLAEARRSDLDLIESAHLRIRVIEELATKMTGAIGQA